ncbi:MAG: hypothetical protein EHM40_12210 [Chloroflexi bacterium]|nr:MAG: hypothetical protein EHM40_12210 [Chloroflexota bacterium]
MSSKSTERHLLPALGLFFLAPLVGEFLLGNLPITWLWTLLTLAPLYGGGALLIRETARRLKWGWPSMIVLALAYALIEEAFVTQSLFNPNYVGLRLLDYGYIPSLGISAWWTTFVLGIHIIWSMAVPIALMESLTPQARQTPWLGPLGFIVTAVVFLIGCALTFMFQQEPFMASPAQFTVSGVIVVVLIVIAAILGRAKREDQRAVSEPLNPLLVAGTAFLLGSVFMSLALVHDAIPASLNVAGKIAVLLTGGLLLWNGSRRADWSEGHRFAVAAGLLLVYAWYGFVQIPSVGDTSPSIDAIGNAFFVVGALLLLGIARKRIQAAGGRTPSTGH